MDKDRDRRLAEVARIAVRIEAETGCPARLLIAQWALESEWGAKPAGAANYFGIKKAARHDEVLHRHHRRRSWREGASSRNSSSRTMIPWRRRAID